MTDGSSSAFKQSELYPILVVVTLLQRFWSRTYKVRDMHCPQLIRENGRHPTSHGLWPSQELSVHPSLLTSRDRLSLCTCMCSSVRNGNVTVYVVPSLLLLCGVSFPWHLTITFQVVQGGGKLQGDTSDMEGPLSVTKSLYQLCD